VKNDRDEGLLASNINQREPSWKLPRKAWPTLTPPVQAAIVTGTEGSGNGLSEPSARPVTQLLARWRSGDREALDELVPLVYAELRQIARRHLQRERPGHTLQSAALVNEAYLRMSDQEPFQTQDRAHFLAVASRLMRQVLVDHARTFGAAKRGADKRVELDVSLVVPQMRSTDVIALDDALLGLAKLDEQQARLVEMRFFGGLSTEEIAEVLGVSASTIKREWNVAKAWLTREMKRGNRADSEPVGED
jgi:RNA polymerase sigma factor (TIGR02999 family)